METRCVTQPYKPCKVKLFALAPAALLIALAWALLAGGLAAPQQAFADTTETVSVNVKYCQTEARSMLTAINEFRASGASCWNSDDSAQVKYTGLSALTYDYDLEKVAMQRAAEIAVSFDHTRPSNQDCWSAYSDAGYSCTAYAENIAAGQTSAAKAFESWQEANENYSGQGHRRNMLSSSVTSIGIGCVYFNGFYYWVQDFSKPSTAHTGTTTANDSSANVNVSVSLSLITVTAKASPTSVSVVAGNSTSLPTLSTTIRTGSTWPKAAPVTAKYTWSSANTSVAAVSSSTLTGVAKGSTNLTTTVLGESVSVPVTVQGDISKATVSVGSATYTGSALTPGVTVKSGSTTLTKDTDYTVEYSNNTNAGTGTVTVTGKGDYAGTQTATFAISKAASSISLTDQTPTYNGSSQVYSGAVVKSGSTGAVTYAYYSDDACTKAVEASAVKNAGTYYVEATLAGDANHESATSAAAKFTINQAAVTVTANAASKTYGQNDPSFTATVSGLVGDDAASVITYTVTRSNANVNDAGAYAGVIVASGNASQGNYAVTYVPADFTINKAASSISLVSQEFDYDGAAHGYSGKVTKTGSAGAVTYAYYSDAACTKAVEAAAVKNAGTYYVKATVAADGNYEAATSDAVTLTIKPVSISEGAVAAIVDQTYTGAAIEPGASVTLDGKTLVAGSDYTVAYSNNVNAGTATATITGKGNYVGTLNSTFTINKAVSSISLANQALVYNGKLQAYSGSVVKNPAGVTATFAYYADAACTQQIKSAGVLNAGTYYVVASIAETDNYSAATSAPAKLVISKAANPVKAKASTKTVKYKKAKKKAQTVKAITVSKAQGKVTYKKLSGSGKFKVNAKTGKITVKKGTKKGTYKIKVKVSSAGNGNYKSATKTITVKIKVK